jgi:hypothetical protein
MLAAPAVKLECERPKEEKRLEGSAELSPSKRRSMTRRNSFFKLDEEAISSSQDLEEDPAIEGYLQKRTSGLRKRWQTRYFRVVGSYLQYLNAPEADGGVIQGAVDLRSTTSVKLGKGSKLVITLDGSKDVHLNISEESEAQKWLDVVLAVIESQSNKADSHQSDDQSAEVINGMVSEENEANSIPETDSAAAIAVANAYGTAIEASAEAAIAAVQAEAAADAAAEVEQARIDAEERMEQGLVRLQAMHRGKARRQSMISKRGAATILQAVHRGKLRRESMATKRGAATRLQALQRGKLGRDHTKYFRNENQERILQEHRTAASLETGKVAYRQALRNGLSTSTADIAAEKIQALCRGALVRQYIEIAFICYNACVAIQKVHRGSLVRRRMAEAISRLRTIISFQSVVRGRQCRRLHLIRERAYNPNSKSAKVSHTKFQPQELAIDVVGFDISRNKGADPFTTFTVLSIHLPTGRAWRVFRRYSEFVALQQQISSQPKRLVGKLLKNKQWPSLQKTVLSHGCFGHDFLEARQKLLSLFVSALASSEPPVCNLIQVQVCPESFILYCGSLCIYVPPLFCSNFSCPRPASRLS